MNREAFVAGVGQALAKNAGVTDWVRQNVFQPFAQGTIDKHYRGLGTYNPQTGGVEPNTMNAIRAVTDVSPVTKAPSEGFLQKKLYQAGGTGLGKWLTQKVTGQSDETIGSRLSSSTNGVFSMGDSGVQVDRSKIPGMMASKARAWMASHGDMVKGLGLGAAAVGLGALAFRSAKPKPTPQVAAPGGQAAAPFTGVNPPGRRGNYFQKYQE